MKKSTLLSSREKAIEFGALGEIRTHDPCLRRAILYPAELQAHGKIIYTLFLLLNQVFLFNRHSTRQFKDLVVFCKRTQ